MSNTISRRDFLKLGGVGMAGAAIATSSIKPRRSYFTADKTRPNVLLIVMDTVRADRMGLYGYHKSNTPNLEEIAGQGILYKNAIAPSSWTLASHASMFTGKRPSELGVDWWTPLDTTYPTLAEVFRDAGYLTAGFIANYYYCSRQFGLNRGFEHYEEYLLNLEQILMSGSLTKTLMMEDAIYQKYARHNNFGRKSAEMVTSSFLEWLERQEKNANFFTFLNYYDAHDPYLPPEQFVPEYKDHRPHGFVDDVNLRVLGPDKVREMSNAYDGTIAYVDQQIGILINELKKSGHLENTLVIITSDHGEQFSEHGLLSHGNSLYRTLIQVPLIMVLPGLIAQNQVVNSTVGMDNLPSTIVDLVNLDTNVNFPGRSIMHQADSSQSGALIRSEFNHFGDFRGGELIGPWHSLIQSQWHYLHQANQVEELYDYTHDPLELNNLAETKAGEEVLEEFRSLL